MDKYSILFNKISASSKMTGNFFFSELIKKEYVEENGWGFSDVNLIESIVSAILLKKITAYYHIWNEKTGEMERQSYNMVKEVSFYIDFNKSYLAVEGGMTNMNMVKQAFRNLFWKEFVYTPLSMIPYDYLEFFQEDKLLKGIEELTINDFKYSDMFLGCYVARLIKPLLNIEILSVYKLSIAKVKAMLYYENETITFVVTKTNNLTILCSENVKFKFFEYLTTRLY